MTSIKIILDLSFFFHFFQAKTDDGRLHLMIIRKEVTKSDLLKLMSKVEEGKHATIPGVEMIPVTAFRYQIKRQ